MSEHQTKLHVYKISDVFRIKRAIESDVTSLSLLGATMEPEDFAQLARRLHELLPPRIKRQVILDSLVHFAGERVTKPLLAEIGWRLAGNVPRLRRGLAVTPWRRQARDEWVPMQIVEQVPRKNRKGDLGAIISFRVLAGTSCMMLIEKFWSHRLCKFLSEKLGFSQPWGKYPFKKIAELVGLRLYGLIDAEHSLGAPVFDQVNVPTSVEKHNRKLMRFRQREGFTCPKKFQHPCHMCPIGYDQCRCGVHPRTFVKAKCGVCEKVTWMDPLHLEVETCVRCFVKRQLARKD